MDLQLFSMFPSILTFDFALNLGSFLTFWGSNGLFWGQGGVNNCFGVSLYRPILFVSQYGSISRIYAQSSSLKFAVDGQPKMAGRVREKIATNGPNSSAEAEMD